jgi:hypothetical protein
LAHTHRPAGENHPGEKEKPLLEDPKNPSKIKPSDFAPGATPRQVTRRCALLPDAVGKAYATARSGWAHHLAELCNARPGRGGKRELRTGEAEPKYQNTKTRVFLAKNDLVKGHHTKRREMVLVPIFPVMSIDDAFGHPSKGSTRLMVI